MGTNRSAARLEGHALPARIAANLPATMSIAFAQQSCDTGNPCTIGMCAADGSCTETTLPDGTACDDGDPCTTGDSCLGATCTGTALPEGTPCTYPDAGLCVSRGVCTMLDEDFSYCNATGVVCPPSGDPCQLSGCDALTGRCVTIPITCPDQCNQVGQCDPGTGQCAYTVKPCAGDCNGDGEVTVNEIITLVNIALGNAGASACPDGIPSGGSVNIALIIQAVNNALSGTCG